MSEKRVTIIYNPMSGRPGRRAERAGEMARLLKERGIGAEARATEGPNHATTLAREAVTNGASVVVGYGGDGTLNEIIQGMVGGPAALAVWAGGTANVVALDLGMPSGLGKLADVIAAAKTTRISLGVARREREGDERYFFMFAGVGLDASIARGVNQRLKRRTGEFAFWVEGLKHLVKWQPEPFTIDVDGARYESGFTLIANGKGYGGGLCMTPEAKLEDPWFDVYILPPHKSNLGYLRDLAWCMRGQIAKTSGTTVRGKHVRANSSDGPWVETDGEVIGPLPMSFDIVPDALSVVVP
jgi:diacylglycerol kinase (ATP)